MYCLVVTDDYSRFTWVFFLSTKDETSGILKSFITRIENLVDHKVKVIRYDNEAEFKNREMNYFCEMKGIMRQFSVARTPQQNRVAERRNRTLIKAARTMLVDSKTRIVEENLHIRFSENTPNVVGSRLDWLFDIDALTRTMNYEPIVTGTQSNDFVEKEDNVNNTNNVNTASSTVNAAGTNKDNELPFDPNMHALEDVGTFDFSNKDEDDDAVADMNNLDTTIQVTPTPTIRIHKDHPLDQVIRDLHLATQTQNMTKNLEEHRTQKGNSCIEGSKLDRGYAGRASTIQVTRRHTQEEGINYDEFFAPVARIEAIWLFLAYASFKNVVVYHMDVKSAFLYGKIKEEVYVCQPPGFEDPDFLDRVYKKNDGIFLSQDKYFAEILKKFKFPKVKNASTPMETQKPLLKDGDGEEVDVYMYRRMIGSLMYLTSSRPDIMFALDNAKMFYVNDLHGEEMFVEKDVTDSIATTDSAVATITTKEITLAQALVEIKTTKPKTKGILLQEPIGVRVSRESLAYREYGIRLILPPRLAKALHEKVLLKALRIWDFWFVRSMYWNFFDWFWSLIIRVMHQLEFHFQVGKKARISSRSRSNRARGKITNKIDLKFIPSFNGSLIKFIQRSFCFTHWKTSLFLIDQRAIPDYMPWRHLDLVITDIKPVVGSYNQLELWASMSFYVCLNGRDQRFKRSSIMMWGPPFRHFLFYYTPLATTDVAVLKDLAATTPSTKDPTKDAINRDLSLFVLGLTMLDILRTVSLLVFMRLVMSGGKVTDLNDKVTASDAAFVKAKAQTYLGDIHALIKGYKRSLAKKDAKILWLKALPAKFASFFQGGWTPVKNPQKVDHQCCYGSGDSLDGIFCQECTCKSCGKAAHYGYNCPSKVPIICNPKPCHNQNVKEFPQTLTSFHLTCYSGDENSFAYDSTPNFINDSLNVFNPPPQTLIYSNEFCGNDAQYGHDCPPQILFIYNQKSCYNQDFNFPQNFQSFQQQYPCCENCEESLLYQDSLIISSSKIDSLFNEFAGELILLKSIPLGIDEADYDPEEEIRLIEKLLYDNSSPRPPKEINFENSDAAIESFSPSPIPVEDSDSVMEEIDFAFTPDNSMAPGIENDDYDSKVDILILEELLSNDSFSLPENESFHFDIPSSPRPPAKPSDDDEIEPNSGILTVKVVGDISKHYVPMPRLLPTQSTLTSNEEKSPHLLSYRGLKAFQLSSESPMMIYEGNIPILDVPFLHFYPL
uniref:Putative ribonuclease H-like domain-containing protein n=1 Tax=Tanacetum cinerariifolium TaxID=118510 RepID=A0A699GNU3_TANCI|nr:putative ribonuclease H-like domain-containing protein [Tanacetum cinerariifolium]